MGADKLKDDLPHCLQTARAFLLSVERDRAQANALTLALPPPGVSNNDAGWTTFATVSHKDLAALLLQERAAAAEAATALATAVGRWWADRSPANVAALEGALRAYEQAK